MSGGGQTGYTGLVIVCVLLAEPAWGGANTGRHLDGDSATVRKGYSNLLTVAPALEYLWDQHVGIIAGPWMSLRGRNTSEFFGAVVALYLYL